MGREMGGTSIGAGIITQGHDEAWDVNGLGARVNVWHHAVLVYDSDTVHFYLDGTRSTDESDHGDILARATDVTIGQAGQGSDHEYFTGMIDEVKIFSRALAHEEVLEIYRSTLHSGGHCENSATLAHCNVADGDGNYDFCEATSARKSKHTHPIPTTPCFPEMSLKACLRVQSRTSGPRRARSGGTMRTVPSVSTVRSAAPTVRWWLAARWLAWLAYRDQSVSTRTRRSVHHHSVSMDVLNERLLVVAGVWDGIAVTACLEVDWSREILSSGLKFSAASSDETICGNVDLSCAENTDARRGCGTAGSFEVFVSGAQRVGPYDYTTFHHQGTVALEGDLTGAQNGYDGAMLFDEMSFVDGEQAVQYVAVCRTGAGAGRDNILLDYLALRASGRDYDQNGQHCDPRPPPPVPTQALPTAAWSSGRILTNCYSSRLHTEKRSHRRRTSQLNPSTRVRIRRAQVSGWIQPAPG